MTSAATPAERLAAHLRGAGESVELVETHGAWVVLGRDRAWKIKKPVVFGPLDASTAARRAELCRRELDRNRAWAPSVYRSVVGLRRTGAALAPVALPCAGVEEHAVLMRRYRRGDTLAAALAMRGGGAVDLVGARVAEMHARAAPATGGGPAAVRAELDELFSALARDPETRARAAAGERSLRASLAAASGLLAARAAGGHVRAVHGDLRAEHVLLENGRIELLDALEFSPALYEIDVAEDIAFLVMDLHALGAGHLAPRLLAAYRAAGGDPGPDRLVHFFATLKAWVRVRVARRRARQSRGPARRGARREAEALMHRAARLAWRARGVEVIAVGGTAATGKSTLAAALHDETGFPVLCADRTRKARAGLAPAVRGGAELYTPMMDRQVHADLGARAAQLRERGRGAIIDATLRRARDRRALLGAAGREPDLWVECRAPEAVVLERATAREDAPAAISDAGRAEAARQLAAGCSTAGAGAARWCGLRTDRPVAAVLDELAALADARAAVSAIDAVRHHGDRDVAVATHRVRDAAEQGREDRPVPM